MDLSQLLSSFTPDQLSALKQHLDGLTDMSGRSPLRPRQLHDLRLLPTKDDPRPTFFWSAESPRHGDVSKTTEYPKLLWHRDTAEEITVRDRADEIAHAEDYTTVAPLTAIAIDPMDAIREALERLTPDERAAILKGQHEDRVTALRAQLAALSPDEIAALTGGQPVKRKGGRPRKEAVA